MSCSLDEQLVEGIKGREEHQECPSPKAEGEGKARGSGMLPVETPGPASALLFTPAMQAPWCPSPESSRRPPMPSRPHPPRLRRAEASGCLPSAGRPEAAPPTRQQDAGLSPADASYRLWPERSPGQSPGHRCSYSPAPEELLEKSLEPAFLNPPLSGKKRGPSLLRLRAPGCPPSGASHRLQVHAALVCTAGCWPKSLQRGSD